MKIICWLTIALSFCWHAGICQPEPIAFTNAHIIPVEGSEIENGILIVQNGKIVAVGPAGSISIPGNARQIDASGKVIMPGLVDTHSHLGDGSGGDRSNALNPEVRILDALDPTSDGFKRALSGGRMSRMPGLVWKAGTAGQATGVAAPGIRRYAS